MSRHYSMLLFAIGMLSGAGRVAVACDLAVEGGWIRAAPPGAPSIAAYAVLRNTGAKSLEITAIHSDAADMTMLHESTVKDGMAGMRMLSSLKIAAGGKSTLAPGGKHIMLTGPKKLPKAGEHLKIAFTDSTGCVTEGDFTVRPLTAD